MPSKKRGAQAANRSADGTNRIYQGDAVSVMNGLEAESVDVIFADPPYNLQLEGELRRPNNSRVNGVEEQWDKFDSFAAYDAFTAST